MTTITSMTATDIVQQIHQRSLSVADVAHAYLERIGQYDHLILAYATVNEELAEGLRLPRPEGALVGS